MIEVPMQIASFDSEPGKPPWQPRVEGVVTLLLGPLAGALVTYVNFKRLGQERKANLTLAWSIPATLVIAAALLYLPDALTRVFGLCVEAAGVVGYPAIQKEDFALWEQSHQQVQPPSGWRSLGLTFLGLIAFFAFAFGIGFGQSKLEEVHINRGNQLLDQKRFEEARKEYKLAAKIDPNDPLPHLGMGDSLAGEQKWADASLEYKAACGLKSDSIHIKTVCEALVN